MNEIRFNCTHCRCPYSAQPEMAGQLFSCQSCRTLISVPLQKPVIPRLIADAPRDKTKGSEKRSTSARATTSSATRAVTNNTCLQTLISAVLWTLGVFVAVPILVLLCTLCFFVPAAGFPLLAIFGAVCYIPLAKSRLYKRNSDRVNLVLSAGVVLFVCFWCAFMYGKRPLHCDYPGCDAVVDKDARLWLYETEVGKKEVKLRFCKNHEKTHPQRMEDHGQGERSLFLK